MTRPGIEPRSPGSLANTLTIMPMPGYCYQYKRRKNSVFKHNFQRSKIRLVSHPAYKGWVRSIHIYYEFNSHWVPHADCQLLNWTKLMVVNDSAITSHSNFICYLCPIRSVVFSYPLNSLNVTSIMDWDGRKYWVRAKFLIFVVFVLFCFVLFFQIRT